MSTLLSVVLFLPLAGALLLLMMPKEETPLHRGVGLGISLATFFVSIGLIAGFNSDVGGYQFVIDKMWVASIGARFKIGIDGISLWLVILTTFLTPLVLLSAHKAVGKHVREFVIAVLVLETGMLGALVALDLFVFYIFWEIMLIPMYLLIGIWGGDRRIYASIKFVIYTMVGSLLMLVAIFYVYIVHGEVTGLYTFDLERLRLLVLPHSAQVWCFAAFALAFAIKVPLFPVHTWLPDAHTEAPTAGSVILAGVMLKLGTYGYIRYGLYLFPEAAHDLAWLFLTLGVVGVVYGAVVATMQRDLKRLVAYSSVAHMGFIVIGIFALNTQGLDGAIIQMVNHGLSTGALFLLVGWIYERRHTREISALSGLQGAAPIMAGVFTLVMLSSIGLPGLNGFVGEFLILLGAFQSARWWAIIAATGVILAALYLLWAYQRVFHGKAEGENATMADLRFSEFLAIGPLLVLIVFLGVYPKPMLERIEPSVDALVAHIERHVDDFVEDEPEAPREPAGVEQLTEALEKAEGHGEGDGHGDGDDHGGDEGEGE